MASPIYRTLDRGKEEIRLFELLPADDNDVLVQGRLHYHSLARKPVYNTVSYVWGDPGLTGEQIEVDGQTLRVTPNLHKLLRNLRSSRDQDEGGVGLLWIDAICINQQDLAERNHQVAKMRQIYERCRADLVWLGPTSDDDAAHDEGAEEAMEAGLRLLGTICATNDIRTLQGLDFRFPTDLDSTTGKAPASWRAAAAVQHRRSWEMTYEDQSVLGHAIFRPDIWNRIWVVQELACAPRVVLMAGREGRLEWDVVARFLAPLPPSDAFHRYVGSHGSRLQREVGMLLAKLKRINDQRTLTQKGERQGLLDVLARWSESASTDPRDRIYAVLGLAPQGLRFPVDYSRILPQVHLDAARAIINHSANLDIIAQNPWPHDKTKPDKKRGIPAENDETQEQQLAQQLPSWVPSFTVSLRTRAAADKRPTLLFAQRGIFRAGPPTCQVPCLIADDDGDGALRARGVVLDTVGKIIPEQDRMRHYRSDSDETPYVAMRSCLGKNLLDDESGGPACYVSGEPAFTAYWRTLATDRTGFPMKRLQADEIETLDRNLRERMEKSMRRHNKNVTSPSNDTGSTEPNLPKDGGEDSGEDSSQEEESYLLVDTICDPVWSFTYTHWGFNVTEKGLYAMLLRGRAQQGDVIACLEGAKVPLVLRQKYAVEEPSTTGEELPRFEVIGPAYVHGFMDMEAFDSVDLRERLRLKTEDIFLV
ncbi:hypothetical protein PG993_012788 [Apiospora rasikravindrae]|uniref:Heterokaryon incompatibility domain-containing protein n=1 Tax=Apiospora rasikravindrae TaxID=990691 RepID=A0ABR1RVS9_9PEZI